MVFGFFRRKGEEYKLAYELFRKTFNELVNALYLSPEISRYPPPEVVLEEINDFGGYDPITHTLIINKTYISDFVRMIKRYRELKKLLENKESLSEEKRKKLERYYKEYEYLVKTLWLTYRIVLISLTHEIIHAIRRYRLLSIGKVREIYDPSRVLVEEALATLGSLIFRDADKREIIAIFNYFYHLYKKEEKFGQYLEKYLEKNIETIWKDEIIRQILGGFIYLEGLFWGDKEAKLDVELLKKVIKKAIRADISRYLGYVVGCLAALGLQDLPKEERLKILSNLIKEENLKKLHDELLKLQEKGLQVLSQFPRRDINMRNLMM